MATLCLGATLDFVRDRTRELIGKDGQALTSVFVSRGAKVTSQQSVDPGVLGRSWAR